MDESEQETSKAQFDQRGQQVTGNQVNVAGDLNQGYTAAQVSVLLTQIKSDFQPKPFDGKCPYVGLVAFEEKDKDRFFGREELVIDLLTRVQQSRFVLIAGPSGSGKSSVVRAGLIPKLKEGGLPASEHWLYETLKPGRNPLNELARVVSSLTSKLEAGDDIRNKGLSDPTVLHRWLEIALKGQREARTVILVDQFEELFTQVADEKERVAFLDLLIYAATIENSQASILLTLRSDFVSNCALYPQLNNLLNQEFIQVGPMQGAELVSAIARPALQVGLRIDPDLVAQVVNDMHSQPGALPLMQFALKDLFDSQQAKGGLIALTLDDYLKRGGIGKALQRYADERLAQLAPDEQGLARSIFSGLIQVGHGSLDTRRTATVDELTPAGIGEDAVRKVIDKLAQARLITTDERDQQDIATISHERLIEAWPWLQRLVNENRTVIELQNRIGEDATRWESNQRDPSYLYSGARLATVQEQWIGKKLTLSEAAKAFVEAGIEAREKEAREEEEARQHEEQNQRDLAAQAARIQAEQRRATILRRAALGLSGLLVVAVLATAYTLYLRNQVAQQGKIANALFIANNSQLKTDSSSDLALLLAAEAAQAADLPSIHNQLLYANQRSYEPEIAILGLHSDQVWGATFSPDGKTIATASVDSTIQLWDAATHQPIRRLESPRIGLSLYRVVISKKYVVAGARGGYVLVWEVETGKLLKVLPLHHDDVFTIALSPDGQRVATASVDDAVMITDLTTWQSKEIGSQPNWVWDIAFSPDGQLLASAGKDKAIHLWDLSAPANITATIVMTDHNTTITSLAFYPSITSTILASGDELGRVIFWDIKPWRMKRDYPPHTSLLPLHSYGYRIWGMDFNPDGQLLATASSASTFKFWTMDISQGVKSIDPKTFSLYLDGHTKSLSDIKFSPDGKTVVVASWDGTASLWAVNHGNLLAAQEASIQSLAQRVDEQTLVAASIDGTITTWDIGKQQLAWQVTIRPQPKLALVKLSPDGSLFATTDLSGTLRLYAVEPKSTRATKLAYPLTNLLTETSALAFNPSGSQLAVGNTTGMITLIDSKTGELIKRLAGHSATIHALSYSADGSLLASSACDKDKEFPRCAADTVRTWDVTTGQPTGEPLSARSGYVTALAFDHKNKTLASGSTDFRVLVWDLQSRKELYTHRQHTKEIETLLFSPNDQWLVSAGVLGAIDDNTGSIILWDVANGVRFGRSFNEHDATVNALLFSPDGKTLYSAAENGFIVVNDLNVDHWFARACQLANRNLSASEWQQYVKDRPYHKTCSQWPNGEGIVNGALPSQP